MIRRRYVIYVEGYDPQGAAGYHRLLQRASRPFGSTWSIALTLGPLQLDSEDLAHWEVEACGPNWQVATRYDFLRQERFIRADMAQPLLRHIPRALGWVCGDLIGGTTLGIIRASWRFALHLMVYQALLLAWLGFAAAAGLLVGAAGGEVGLSGALRWLAAAAAAFAVFVLLRPLAYRWGVIQIASCWPRLREFARGRPGWIDHVVDVGARRLLAVARAGEVDEIVVVGHSAGGIAALALVARALELDPDLGHRGSNLVLLTLGSVMPAAALDPAAERLRNLLKLVAGTPSVTWIDCCSKKDPLSFWGLDPVEGVGVRQVPRHNPLIWTVSIKDMLSPKSYARLKWSPFRRHYQFIMSGERRAPYDYVMLIAGPAAVVDWARSAGGLAAAFGSDGTFIEHPAADVGAGASS